MVRSYISQGQGFYGRGIRVRIRMLMRLRCGCECGLYFKLRKAFSKFYRRHSALVEKYSVSLKTLLQQGISVSEFYGDLVYRFRKIVGKSNFSEQFRNILTVIKQLAIS